MSSFKEVIALVDYPYEKTQTFSSMMKEVQHEAFIQGHKNKNPGFQGDIPTPSFTNDPVIINDVAGNDMIVQLKRVIKKYDPRTDRVSFLKKTYEIVSFNVRGKNKKRPTITVQLDFK